MTLEGQSDLYVIHIDVLELEHIKKKASQEFQTQIVQVKYQDDEGDSVCIKDQRGLDHVANFFDNKLQKKMRLIVCSGGSGGNATEQSTDENGREKKSSKRTSTRSKSTAKKCINCKQPGHLIADCPIQYCMHYKHGYCQYGDNCIRKHEKKEGKAGQDDGQTTITLSIPQTHVGAIIGVRGKHVQLLNLATGCFIQFQPPATPEALERHLIIAGPIAGVEMVKQTIYRILGDGLDTLVASQDQSA